MPQNGMHAIAGIVARPWMPKKEWLLLGLVLGNIFPDLDNIAVAVATITKADTHGLHRTFTHSIFAIAAMVILFYIIGAVARNQKWNNFGVGLGAGIFMHIVVDLILWFNGVELLWPIKYELNFWSWFTVPAWLQTLLDTAEFLFFGLYFALLLSLARRYGTDLGRLSGLKIWFYVQMGMFVLFTLLFYLAPTIPLLRTIYGALYLVSLIAAIVITIQMRQTVEAI
ncbi:MAG: hypothetical protein KPEEDBHJ_02852 [Anaerolineales bacterium]|nr:hypothetical protein [Anaerolineales bacterium]